VHGFSKNHEANKQLFDFAKRAGVKVITANPEPDSFDSLDKLVAEYDIRIAIHNHGPGALFDKLDSVTKAIAGHDKRIGACVDCGHYLRSGEDPVKCVLELGDRVYGVHIKDEKEMNTKASDNVVIGKGHLDVVGLFKALRQIKFPADGSLDLEYEANPANPIDDMKACLEVAKEAIAKSA
jgi:sugar phosphate isomerase/epimerase